MAFWDDVYNLRKNNLIPRQWKREHIRPSLQAKGYQLTTINSLPSNQSMSRDGNSLGDFVRRRGLEPKAWRTGVGIYELIEDPGDTLEVQHSRKAEALRLCGNLINTTPLSSSVDSSASSVEQLAKSSKQLEVILESRSNDIENRTGDLCSNFADYIKYFNERRIYTGPSVYFHLKTIARLKELGRPLEAAKDPYFRELLYATLVAWGMHRMGEKRGAKMPDFKTFSDSLIDSSQGIESLSNYTIYSISSEDIPEIVDKLWRLIDELKGSTTTTKLVANSKILHHLLPNLVPPIDNTYTAKFFKFRLYGRDKQALEFIYPKMVSIAQSLKHILSSYNYDDFHSSPTKIIDNAIIGYVLKNPKA